MYTFEQTNKRIDELEAKVAAQGKEIAQLVKENTLLASAVADIIVQSERKDVHDSIE